MTLLIMMFLFNMLFMFMFHPLAMIFILIIQTLLTAMLIFFTSQFPWFSYTLILVFLGGMLILFMYMSNIASNEMFKPNYNLLMLMLMVPLFNLTLEKIYTNYSKESNTTETLNFLNLSVLKPYSELMMPLTIMMALYIILALLTIVKISKMNQGPLRIN
uniref:NADH dehydrogenase subunit 6 n=1 Tax=Gibbosaverruca weijiai TaxID=2977348 RepID=UPI0021CC510C|nr:NADH dehydrogenase subunit 6 [Gibbosaverruca weijiai]UWM12918.1 NADH dehydrogenase subunit 6 [Gibbosaverruca weijiai]